MAATYRRNGWKARRPFRLSAASLLAVLLLGAVSVIGYGKAPGGTATAIPSTAFRMCGRPPHSDCVIDGDTFYLGAQSIRIADIDTPEVRGARCDVESNLAAQATNRLYALLNAGPFSLTLWDDRDADQYGRKLRVVMRDGRSVGSILVAEGLAREWTGPRRPWCA